MVLEMPSLETKRQIIRPFVLDDLEDAYRLFDIDVNADDQRNDQDDQNDYRKHPFFLC
jgi:hypothetical protein